MTWSKPSPRRRMALHSRRLAARPAIEIVEDRTLLAAHIVTTGLDVPTSGQTTLREAMAAAAADDSGAANLIQFDSGVTLVQVDPALGALPDLPTRVTIDGGSLVTIDGGGGAFDAFRLIDEAASSEIRNLTIRDFQGAAIMIQVGAVTVQDNVLGEAGEVIGRGVLIDGSSSAAVGSAIHGNTIGFATAAGVEIRGVQASGNRVYDNRIGTDDLGVDRGNLVGVLVDGSPSNEIGVDGANTIGHNDQAGVRITGAAAVGNVVQGNRIGFDGGVAMGNPIGIDVQGVGAATPTTIAGNFIDVASTAGVRIAAGAAGVRVRGNTIGMNGTTTGQTSAIGVLVDGAAANAIGGNGAGDANTIVRATTAGVVLRSTGTGPGNVVSGNFIGTDALGAPLGNVIGVWIDGLSAATAGNMIGGTADGDGNTIGFSSGAGVRIEGVNATGNTVAGNFIGADESGDLIGNAFGVQIVGAASNEIGGTTADAGNDIDASSVAAVSITGTTATNNRIRANRIGLQGAASMAARNALGVLINGAGAGNQVGGAGDEGNTIGNATTAAIQALQSTLGGSIEGNFIGVTRLGVAIPNPAGVQVFESAGFAVGAAGRGNYIANNLLVGVEVAGAGATANLLAANVIGIAPGGTGVTPAPNAFGVRFVGVSGNTVGAGNVIGFSLVAGVQIAGTAASADNNVVIGSFIGTDGVRSNLGNAVGVRIDGPATGNRIGVDALGAIVANTIGFNQVNGVLAASGSQNRIIGNQYIGSNGPSAPASLSDINLAPGANENAQPPGLTSATITGPDAGPKTINLTFSAPLPAGGSTIQVYQIAANGDRVFVIQAAVTSGGETSLTISNVPLAGEPDSLLVTMTTATGSTSRFSNESSVADPFLVTEATGNDVGSLAWVIGKVNTIGDVNGQAIAFAPGIDSISVEGATPLPSVTRRIFIEVTTTVIIAQVGAPVPVDGLILAQGSNGSRLNGLTFQSFVGAGVRSRSDSNSIQASVFDGNGIGLVIEGASNRVGDAARNTFQNSTSAGIQIIGTSATGNRIQANLIESNPVGVAIVGAGGNFIGGEATSDDGLGNDIRNNPQQGVSILSGDGNTVRWNSYTQNGPNLTPPPTPPAPPDPPTYSTSSNIVLGPTANSGVGSGSLLSAVQGLDFLTLLVQAGTSWTDTPTFQIYEVTDTDANPLDLGGELVQVENVGPGLYSVRVEGAFAQTGDRLAVVATIGSNTAAFTSDVTIFAPNVVVNTEDDGDGSLRGAVEYIRRFAELHPGEEIDRNIYFRISTEAKGPDGFWTIELTRPIYVQTQVFIDGRNTSGPPAPFPPGEFYVPPSVRLIPEVSEPDPDDPPVRALRFVAGSDESWVGGLDFLGFRTSSIEVGVPGVSVYGNTIVGPPRPSIYVPPAPTVFQDWIGTGIEIIPGASSARISTNYLNQWATAISVQGEGSNAIVGNIIGIESEGVGGNVDGVSIDNSPGNFLLGNTIGNSRRLAPTAESFGAAVRIEGPASTDNFVVGSYLGVRPSDGSWTSIPNDIGVYVASPSNFIGRLNAAEALPNVIGNSWKGVWIVSIKDAAPGNFIGGNTVAGNLIGVDPAGGRQGNFDAGVAVEGEGTAFNRIGLIGESWQNVIGWSGADGIRIRGGGGNQVANNFVGVTPAGAPIPNGVGVRLTGTQGNHIGPAPDAAGSPWVADLLDGANFISANVGQGLLLETDAISYAGAHSNWIAGNLIGRGRTLPTAPSPFVIYAGNGGVGVEVQGGSRNVIGGGDYEGALAPRALTRGLANLIIGNRVGVSLIDGLALGGSGVGDENAVLGNLVSGNLLDGVRLDGDLGRYFRSAIIAGNFVGTSFDGLSTRLTYGDPTFSESGLNGLNGVRLRSTGGGWAGPGDPSWDEMAVEVRANLLSGNGLNGLEIGRSETASAAGPLYARVLVEGNYAGVGLTGAVVDASGSPFGNRLNGVRIADVGGVRVGGQDYTAANVLSGNLGRGLEISWAGTLPSAPGDTIEGMTVTVRANVIGAAPTGTSIVVDGRDTGNLADGVFLLGDVVATIQGNLIGGNRGSGVHARDDGGFAGRLFIEENYIGTNGLGADLYNISDGVFIDKVLGLGTNNQVFIRRNSIGANRSNGVHVAESTGVAIAGNVIGAFGRIFNLDGAADLGNFSNGIFLNSTSGVTVGGGDPADRNIISGNRAAGVLISGQSESGRGNFILGNFIGTDWVGLRGVGNHNSGVVVNGSGENWIGAPTDVPGSGYGNLISGNRLYGVLVVGSGPGGAGNFVVGNLVGTNRTGTSGLANSADGVFLLDSPNNKVGVNSSAVGGDSRSRNVISGNDAQGVRVFGAPSINNVIAGNYIGVGSDGSSRIGNKANGVIVDNAGYNTIGGVGAGRNVISGNAQSGVQVSSTLQDALGAWIVGNYIGTDATGTGEVPNGANGVLLFGASSIEISSNVISGNSYDGVQIFSPSSGARADSNRIYDNKIGTDATGLNPLGNRSNGVSIINGFNNLVGFRDGEAVLTRQDGTTYANPYRNVISANANGVVVDFQAGRQGNGTLPNRISGNIVGLDVDGERPLGNKYAGVLVNNALGTIIGYRGEFVDARGFPLPDVDSMLMPYTITPGEGYASNVISDNRETGIYLTGTTAGTKVGGNYLGTDIRGRTYDDAGVGLNFETRRAAVLVDAQATYNSIGGVTQDERIGVPGTGNLITQSRTSTGVGQAIVGVLIDSIGASNNQVLGNVIGLDTQGRSGSNQIGVLVNNATDTRIGWTGAARNVIAGNALAGVEIGGPLAARNGVFNNYIGTHSNGTTRPGPRQLSATAYNPSQEDGVLIVQSSGNLIGYGMFEEGLGNLISGNGNGVNITSQDSDGPAASTNYVSGNRIGVDATGMKSLPNFRSGVFITASPNNDIRNNLISANGLAGVQIYGGRTQQGGQGSATALGTTIVGNTIGLNLQKQLDFSPFNGSQQIHPISEFPAVVLPGDNITINLGAQQHGVVVIGASGNQIGLPGEANQNYISGNTLTGVYITKLDNRLQTYATPTGNVVQNNKLWTNGIYGVLRYDAPNGNPALEPPSANSNDFTGTPIPIGDFVTGFNAPTGSEQAQSILLGNAATTAARPGRRPRPAAPSPSRPTPIQRPGLARAAKVQNR